MSWPNYPQNGVLLMLSLDPGILQAGDEFPFKPMPDCDREAGRTDDGPNRPTVLVVDDMHMVADTTVEILNRKGFRAIAAYSGHGALRLVEEFKPDYLLADVAMPAMNGVELAIAVTRSHPATRIILFSGQAGVNDLLRQAHAAGYNFEVLAKPIHPEKLVAHLKKK